MRKMKVFISFSEKSYNHGSTLCVVYAHAQSCGNELLACDCVPVSDVCITETETKVM